MELGLHQVVLFRVTTTAHHLDIQDFSVFASLIWQDPVSILTVPTSNSNCGKSWIANSTAMWNSGLQTTATRGVSSATSGQMAPFWNCAVGTSRGIISNPDGIHL